MQKDTAQPSLLKELLIGFCLGTANIIPGVSGGTFLLIFQIYERVFSILGNIHKANMLELVAHIIKIVFKADKRQSLNGLVGFLKKNDFIFLLKLMAGSLAAIVCLSSLMKYLIVYHFSVTYAFFFGLILISIVIPVKMLTHRKMYLIVFVILGAVSTIYVTYAVNPYEKVRMKSRLYQDQYLKHQDLKFGEQDPVPKKEKSMGLFSLTGKYTIEEYGYASICGVVAISAMVLPGISGSLMLILMGEYFEVVSAISGLKTLNLDNMIFLGCFATGIVFGGLLFVKLFSAVLKTFYNATMAFLTGLMVGSLYALWPFKKSIVMARQYIKTDGVIGIEQNVRVFTNINEFPQMGTEFYISMVSLIIGCIIMFFFVKKEIKP